MSVAKTPDPVHVPPPHTTHRAKRRKTQPRSFLAKYLDKQLEIPLCIVAVIVVGSVLTSPNAHLSTRWTPEPSWHYGSIFRRCTNLSFRKPGTDVYYKGRDDAYIIGFWVVAFALIREALMRWVLEPFARVAGIKEHRSVVRFAEQGYAMTYAIVSFSVGLYIMQTSPYRNLNTKYFWVDYPHEALPALTKWYYLVEAAFWIQQIITINLEARRKDYWQMFTHHIITTILMSLSYILNWTRIGNAILCVMDVVDILLPLAKLLKYTDRPRAADFMFTIFLFTWILTRHVIYGRILYSVYFEFQQYLTFDWRPEDGFFMTRASHYGFAALLTALQVLLCIWLSMILRVVYKMLVVGAPADDIRSDDEEEEETVTEEEENELEPPRVLKAIGVSETGHAKLNGVNGHADRYANGTGTRTCDGERKKDR